MAISKADHVIAVGKVLIIKAQQVKVEKEGKSEKEGANLRG